MATWALRWPRARCSAVRWLVMARSLLRGAGVGEVIGVVEVRSAATAGEGGLLGGGELGGLRAAAPPADPAEEQGVQAEPAAGRDARQHEAGQGLDEVLVHVEVVPLGIRGLGQARQG